MHEEEVNIAGVVDEEGFVAGRHEVTGFSVGAVADLGVGEVLVLWVFEVGVF